jgi:multicomponent Na+:H+ antiporter subunit D
MNWLLVLPIFLPLVVACIGIMLWRSRHAQRAVSLTGVIGQLIVSIALFAIVYRTGIQAVQMGGYPAPFGITIVADLFSAMMVLVASLMGAAVIVYSIANIDHARETYGYHPLVHVLLMGVCGAFLTGDMFNLYVFFEIMLMSSFVLLALGGERGQIEGAIKYVTLNLISSAIFLAGVGILYGITGTLNMANLAVKLSDPEIVQQHGGLLTVLSMMFLVAFGVKAAIFPLFFWLPASYHTPPVAVSAIFAGLLTKVGVYAIIRIFTLIFVHDVGFTHTLILVVAGLTMITGVLGAAAQTEFRRILSFHIISQIGYMIMGLGLMAALATSSGGPPLETTRAAVHLAVGASVFYIVHHIIVKTNLFLVSGVVERLAGTGDLKKLGGMYASWPVLSLLFLVPAMSLAGIPPLSGFWAKLFLVVAGLQTEQYLIVGVALLTGLLTLFSMVKIWAAVFWSEPPEDSLLRDPEHVEFAGARLSPMMGPIVVLAAVTVAIGLGVGPIFHVAMQAGEQLLDPQRYIDAVRPLSIEDAMPDMNHGGTDALRREDAAARLTPDET